MAGEEFRVSLGVELKANELDSIRNQINGLQVNPINLRINTQNVQNQINSIRRQIQSLGNIRINLGGNGGGGGGNHIRRQAEDVVRAYRELSSLQSRLNSKMTALDKLDNLDTSRSQQEIVELTTQINNLYTRYQNLYNLFSQRLSPVQTDNLTRGFEVLGERLNIINSQLRDTNANIVNTINTSFSNGTFANDLSQLDASLAKIRTQSSGVVNGMRQLNVALTNMQTARANGDTVALISNYERYQNALRNVKNQIDINIRSEKQMLDAAKLNDAKISFASKMDIWLSKNSAATKQFGSEINSLKARLQSCDKVQLDHLKAEFTDIQRRAEMAGKATMTFSDRFKMQMGRLSSYFSAATLITYSARAIRSMYDNVVEVDTAMTELYRVTDLTSQQYDALYDNMIASAKEYGSTLTDIISSTADWVRLGFDASTANRLTEITAMYQHISDLDNDTAVENLVTAYKGFQDQLSNMYNGDAAAAVEYIADILNELDNNFAVTADDIGAALTKSASALQLAGNTIQESAAMATGITEVTQDPEKAGSSLKVLSLRLRGMKGELQELGEEIDENVDSISKMQTQILNFTGGKVNIFNDDGSFKSTYEIMQGIAEIYDELSDTNKADLLETIAGKNRANDVAALISNWNQVEAAMKSAMEAEGSAAAENEKYMESIQGRLDALTATWQALSNTILDSDFVKVLITGLTEVLDLLDGVVNTLGSFGTIGVGVGLFNVVKHAKEFANLKIASALPSELKNVSTYAQAAAYDLKAFIKTPAGIASAVGLAVTAINAIVQAYKNWEAEQARLRQATIDTNNEILSSIDTFEQAYVKYSGKTNLTSEEENELTTAINNTITALGGKSSAIQGVIDKNNDYIDSLENVAQAELEEARRRAKENLDAANEGLQSESWDWFSGSEITVSLGTSKSDDAMQKAKSIAESIMADYIDKETRNAGRGTSVIEYEIEPLNWDVDHSNMDAVVDYYYKLIELKDTLLQKSIDENDDSYINNSVYDDAKSAIDALSNSVEEYLTQQYNLAKYDYEIKNGIPKTVEEYYAMRDAILSNINASQDYKDAIGGIADAEWGSIFDIDSYQSSLNKINQITKKFTESNAFQNSPWSTAEGQLQEFNKWVNGLSPEELSVVYDIALNTDTANFTLEEWKSALENYEFPEEAKISFADLIASESFTGNINTHIESIEKLQNALKDLRSGDFSASDFMTLMKDFPELADDANNLEGAIVSLLGSMDSDIASYFGSQFGKLKTEEDVAALKNFQNAVLELGQVVGNTAISIDISAESNGMDNLFKAMKESVSSTGLTAESIKNLKARYQDLENYDASRLFERTSNGIHLNTKALRELESAYEKQKKAQINADLQELVDQYNDLTKEIDNTSDTAKKAELYAKRADIQDQINDTADLAAQYEGLTSAFYKWEQAQSIGEEGDMYDSLAGSLKDIKKLYKEGLIGTNKFRTAVQLMSNEDLSNASIDELLAAYESGYSKMKRYFTDSSDGCLNFLNDVQKLNSEWVKLNEDGSWEINFGTGNDQEIADALGINVESVQAILRKLSDYGFDINLDSMYTSLELLQSEAEKSVEVVNKVLKNMGKDPISFNLDTTNITEVETQITQAQSVLDLFRNSDGTVNLQMEGAEEAQELLIALISKRQLLNAPSVMSVDTSKAEADIGNVITLLQNYQKNYNDIEINTAVGADTSDAQTNIQNILTQLQGIPPETKTALGLDTEEFNNALATLTAEPVDINAGVTLDQTALTTVTSTIAAISPEMIVKAGVDPTLVKEYEASEHTTEGTVVYNVDDSLVDKYTAPNKDGVVRYTAKINSWTVPTRYGTVIYTARMSGTANARGTAFAHGTIGKAFKKGDWGTKESGTALVGELGQELVVRDGRFFTIGDESAEFFNYKKGDIIFNADQTKQIFEKGKISSGSKRGSALASGTAFAEGNAFSSGSGSIIVGGNVTTTPTGSGGSNGSDSKKFKETFDWIETAIDRIERAISRLQLKSSSIYKSWGNRNAALKDQIGEIKDEIELQAEGYNRYMEQANSVGLSEDWKAKVRNGEVDIETITNEGLAEKIKEYQEWYEKALDCKDAIDELNESLAECYKTAFDNVVAEYDGILSVIEHEKNMLDEYISQNEAKGYITSTKYYDALITNEQSTISELEKEKAALLSSFEAAVTSGAIEEGSEAWYEMINQIDAVTLAIEQSETAMIEYANAIRDIEWEVFDLLQSNISQITKEADFLINLMSNKDLYTDNGQMTNEGKATMGLHAQNYNVYMAQADEYAKEILDIDKELANDPYNQDLLARRQELLGLQQESILAAEDEKQAIADMVREGIELELNALEELITNYTDALDSAKDLYDYQKKISNHTQKIGSLEKQLSAYEGDTSEETKAKIQQLKVSLDKEKSDLEDTQYDRYISDTKKLLDEVYLEYESILNQRLDNIDGLISEMITFINSNSETISTTISDAADKVGYNLSEEMKSIWESSDIVISAYGKDFIDNTTTINNTLLSIKSAIDDMLAKLNEDAEEDVSDAPSQAESPDNPTNPTNPTNPDNTDNPTNPDNTTEPSAKTRSEKEYHGVALAIWNGNYGWGSGKTRKKRLKDKGFDADKVQRIINKMGADGYVHTGAWKGKYHGIKDLSPYHYKKFAKGVYNLNKDQLAWTQEKGREMIIRPSDGAVLTPLAKGDSVLNAGATNNIWDMANNPTDFIRDNLKLGIATNPVEQNTPTTYTQHLDRVVFNLPNVKNYEELLSSMQNDKNFERLILAMTIDRVAGKSSLAKGKAIR